MAIAKTIAKRTMTINVLDGLTSTGANKYKAHNYPKVKEAASDEDVYAVGVAIAGLIDAELSDISITEKAILTEVL